MYQSVVVHIKFIVQSRFARSLVSILFLMLTLFVFAACSDGGGDNASGGGAQKVDWDSVYLPFDIGAVYDNEVYVRSGADAAVADGSAARPYADLRSAATSSSVKPGTVVRVMAGRYETGFGFRMPRKEGSLEQPIAFVAQGEVILGPEVFDSNSGPSQLAQFSDAAYLVFDGFIVEHARTNGLNFDDAGSYETPGHHLVFRNMHFRNVGDNGDEDCLKLSGVDNVAIINSEFENCGEQGSAIDMLGCHNVLIAGNYFHDTVDAVQIAGGSSHVVIHGNRFADVSGRAISAGGSTTNPTWLRPSDVAHEAARIDMLANVFERVGGLNEAAVVFSGCDGCRFFNNTMIEPNSWVVGIVQENTALTPSRDGLFVNNIIVFNTLDLRSNSYVNVGAGTEPGSFVFGSNLWYALDNADFSGPPIDSSIPAEFGSIIQQDPDFANANNGNYRVSKGSPAVGKGRSVEIDQFVDYRAKQYNMAVDIGAFAAN